MSGSILLTFMWQLHLARVTFNRVMYKMLNVEKDERSLN